MTTFLIRDGYTEHGYIREEERLYPALRFQFRPLTFAERDAVASSITGKSPSESAEMFCKAVVAHVTKWDAVEDNKALPIDLETVRLMRPNLVDRLYNIISGRLCGDYDKEAPQAPQEKMDSALKSALYGKPPGQVKEERAEKNSVKGSG